MFRIITLDDFNTFSGNYEDSCEQKELKKRLLKSATDIVEDYLGYKVLQNDHEEELLGNGQKKLFLHNVPIEYIYELKINGHCIDPAYIRHDEESISINSKFKEDDEIYVRYNSGYSIEKVPTLIKTTILRIATLLLMESNENIGLTGKTYSDGSRSFINFTNFDKYLRPLDQYKVVRL